MSRQAKILQLMLDKRGVIMTHGTQQNTYAIVPRGDKRCRPVGWVDGGILKRLLAHGAVVQKGKCYILESGYIRRASAAKQHGARGAYANQHRRMQARHIYHPDGIKRPARINSHLSTLTRLANRTQKNGQNFLQPDEIEAAERFASDYACSMMGAVATLDYNAPPGGRRRTSNTAEHISIRVLDARKRVADALGIVGPGLDRALTALCGAEMSMGALEASENWAKGSGKTVLKLALSRLSTYYGCRAGVGGKVRG